MYPITGANRKKKGTYFHFYCRFKDINGSTDGIFILYHIFLPIVAFIVVCAVIICTYKKYNKDRPASKFYCLFFVNAVVFVYFSLW